MSLADQLLESGGATISTRPFDLRVWEGTSRDGNRAVHFTVWAKEMSIPVADDLRIEGFLREFKHIGAQWSQQFDALCGKYLEKHPPVP